MVFCNYFERLIWRKIDMRKNTSKSRALHFGKYILLTKLYKYVLLDS